MYDLPIYSDPRILSYLRLRAHRRLYITSHTHANMCLYILFLFAFIRVRTYIRLTMCVYVCCSLHMHRSSFCPLCTPHVASYPSFLWLSCHAASPGFSYSVPFPAGGTGREEPPWRATDEECNRDSGYPRAYREAQGKRKRERERERERVISESSEPRS